jgi:hypothetical protein
MVCVEARCSVLLNEGCFKGVLDENRVIFTILDKNLDIGDMAVLRAPAALSALISQCSSLSLSTSAARVTILLCVSLTSALLTGFFFNPATKCHKLLS